MKLTITNNAVTHEEIIGVVMWTAEYELTDSRGKKVYVDADYCSEGGVAYRVTTVPMKDVREQSNEFEKLCLENYSSLKLAKHSKYIGYMVELDRMLNDALEAEYGSRLGDEDRDPYGYVQEEEEVMECRAKRSGVKAPSVASVKSMERIHVRANFVQIGCSCMGQQLVAAYRTLKNEADGSTFCMMIRWNGHEDRPACFSVQKSDELMHLFFEDGVYDWERECELNEHGDIELPPEVIASPTYQRVYKQLISSMDKKLQSLGYKLEDDFSVVEA